MKKIRLAIPQINSNWMNEMAELSKALEDLSQRPIDQGLLQRLREMGPHAYNEINTLNSMTDMELKNFSELVNTLERIKLDTENDLAAHDTGL